MAGPLIGALRVSLSAETASFEAGMKRAQRTTATAASGITKSLAGIKAGLTGFAAGLGVGLFARAIKSSLEYAGSLAEVAQQVGVTSKQLQVFRFAAGQVGISAEEMDKGLSNLTVALGKAKLGAEAPKKAFDALSKLIGKDIVASSKQGGDALPLVADGLQKIADRSKRAGIEVTLFKKTGSKLDTLFTGGSKAINELGDALEKLGAILSEEQIKHADDTADKLEAVKTVLSAQIAGVVADNSNSILSLAQSLGILTGQIIKFLSSNPQTALAIMGALAGSRLGLPGAAAGAVAGFIGGDQLRLSAADANNDLAFRRQKLHEARDELNRRRANAASPGALITIRHGSRDSGATVASAQKEFDKQVALAHGAASAAVALATRPRLPAGADVSQFLAPKGGGAKKQKATRDRSDDTLFQFNQEQRRADTDILRAKQDLSHSTAERADIALKILELEKESQDAELDNRVHRAQQDYAEGRITKSALDEVTAQAAILKQKNDQVTKLEAQAIVEQRDEDLRRETNAISEHEYDIRADILQKQSNLAETAEERRKIELELLQIAYEQKKKALDDIVAHSKDTVEIANARADLANLNATHALDQAGVIQQTRGPLENYLASLPTTAAKANEALQNLEVQGFDGLIDSVLALSDGMHSATDSLLNTLKQFLLGLARLELQKALGGALQGGGGGLFGSIAGLFGGGGGGFDSSSLLASNSAAIGFNFASGGSGIFKGIQGIDRNVLSLNGIPFANVSYGERMTISNDNGSSPRSVGGGGGNVAVYVNGVTDLNGFNRSAGQIERAWKRKLR